jgi:transposase
MNTEKNLKIRQTQIETHERRKKQTLKVFELKVNVQQTSKDVLLKFTRLFKEAKWITNDVLASEDVFKYNYKDHRDVVRIDKDDNKVVEHITMQSGVHQTICMQQTQNIINLSKAKKKGRKVGALKFKREVNCIPLKTGQFRVINSKTVSIPSFSKLKVHGIEQFYDKDYEIANCNIIRKASGIYLKVSVCLNNVKKRAITNKEVGLDFGIHDNITTSDGDKYNFSMRETEYLKFLQRQLHRKQKGSKRYWKLRNQTQKEYEHISNCKTDYSNKLVSSLLKDYDWIYFQDENLKGWRKYNKGFAREIQGSILGRVKAKLVTLEGKRTSKVSKWAPTTKACTNCGQIHDEMTLKDRVFKCSCGIEEDRDVHAAKTVKLFGSRKRTECLEQASAEDYVSTLALSALADVAIANMSDEAKTKEDHPF